MKASGSLISADLESRSLALGYHPPYAVVQEGSHLRKDAVEAESYIVWPVLSS